MNGISSSHRMHGININRAWRMSIKGYLVALLLLLFMPAYVYAQQYKRLTNLPHMLIDTENRQSINSKDTYIYATMHFVDTADVVTTYDSLRIRGRGNSTWGLAKKPYRIKFASKEKFLGKGHANAKSWTLLANAGDKTMMRNAITSLMGDFLGLKNNPAHEFCDLTLNGTYIGTYQISDQVEVRPHRVNIAEQDEVVTAESNITGGYLLELDGFFDGKGFRTDRGVYVRIHYPDEDVLVAKQQAYIHTFVNDFEKHLFASNYTDAERGYRPFVDSTSLVNWFLATELTANIDGHYSTYFYKEQDDARLHWGPLWDYDIAYNNDWRMPDTQTKLMVDEGYGSTLGRVWVQRMMTDWWFADLVNRRFHQVVDAGIEQYMYAQIDSVAQVLDQSQRLNFKKWGINTRAYHEIVLYSSYQQYVADVKTFIHKHISYLASAFQAKVDAVAPVIPEPEPEPEPDPKPIGPDSTHWYHIIHMSNEKAFVINHENNICIWTANKGDSTQLWRIQPVGDYVMLINQKTDKALNDPTEGNPTATTLVGAQLNVVTQNRADDRQLWTLYPQDDGETFNLINKFSQHTANLSGGNSQDGTSILSYTTDDRNAISTNRRWRFVARSTYEPPIVEPEDTIVVEPEDTIVVEPEDTIVVEPEDTTIVDPEDPDGSAIDAPEPDEYALAYDPVARILHFGSATPEQLRFVAYVTSLQGKRVRTFQASQTCYVGDLPRGVYIITWRTGGRMRSAKFMLQ